MATALSTERHVLLTVEDEVGPDWALSSCCSLKAASLQQQQWKKKGEKAHVKTMRELDSICDDGKIPGPFQTIDTRWKLWSEIFFLQFIEHDCTEVMRQLFSVTTRQHDERSQRQGSATLSLLLVPESTDGLMFCYKNILHLVDFIFIFQLATNSNQKDIFKNNHRKIELFLKW